MTRTGNYYHPTHEQAVERGKKGGAAGKGKHKAVDPAIAHARACKAGQANKERWARITADRKAVTV